MTWMFPASIVAYGNPGTAYTSTEYGGWGQAAQATKTGGSLGKDGNDFAQTQWVGLQFTGFQYPPLLPPATQLQSAYVVIEVSGWSDAYPLRINGFDTVPAVPAGSGTFSGQYYWSIPVDSPILSNVSPAFVEFRTSGGGTWGGDYLSITFVGIAAYVTPTQPVTEKLSSVWVNVGNTRPIVS